MQTQLITLCQQVQDCIAAAAANMRPFIFKCVMQYHIGV